jgi:hypothetical protein
MKEAVPMVGENIRIPKKGERVGAQGQNGAFIVAQISTKRRTANLKLIGPADYALKEIPWGVLIFFNQTLAEKAKKKASLGIPGAKVGVPPTI